MSKKKRKAGRTKSGTASPRPKRVRWAKAAVAAPLLLCIVAAGAASLRWQPVRRAVGLSPLSEPLAQATPAPLALSKEYVYAGGRLVATEEPTPQPSGPPPTNLVATSSIPSSGQLVVKVTWSAPVGATPTGYVVERAQTRDSSGLQFTALTPAVTTPPTSDSPYLDQSPPAGTVCVYRVRATYASGVPDSYSNMDVATTVGYTGDDPLIGANHQPGQHASVVSALNLTELQGVVDKVRVLAGMSPAAWKNDPAPASRGQILADHFIELRTNLNPALLTLGISQMPPDSTLGQNQPVMASHIQDVREKLR